MPYILPDGRNYDKTFSRFETLEVKYFYIFQLSFFAASATFGKF